MMEAVGKQAKAAARVLALAPTEQKNAALVAIATALGDAQALILEANAVDVAAAREHGMGAALLDRLTLSEARLAAIAADVRHVATLPDPVGERFDEATLPNGLRVHKRRVPMGVVGTIYESRPNVTVDIAGLCLKAGSAAILRGGSDTLRSSAALVQTMRAAIASVGLPADSVQGLHDPDRDLIRQLLRLDRYVDVVIPRGGAGLHRFCRENASVPVITGGVGICHIFVDATADAHKALPIILNAKTSRPSVCNALDTLLVHRDALGLLPQIAEQLGAAGVALHCDEEALAILGPLAEASGYAVAPVAAGDYDTEWMALTMSIRVVDGLEQALDHIALHGDHTDVIVTENAANAEHFLAAVDSAWVGHNASTRFNDGGQMGLGAEIIISTQKLHARGPLGLKELTSYKWVVAGDGQVRA